MVTEGMGGLAVDTCVVGEPVRYRAGLFPYATWLVAVSWHISVPRSQPIRPVRVRNARPKT